MALETHMELRDGFYRVRFSAGIANWGIVVVEGMTVRGGDNQYLFSGVIREEGAVWIVKLRVLAHAIHAVTTGGSSTKNFELTLKGSSSRNSFELSGPFPGTSTPIVVHGNWLASLNL